MNAPGNADDIARKRSRLAELEAALARLRVQYELAMSRFKFDEAGELGARIETAEEERAPLAESLPPVPAPPADIPALLRRPILRRRRR